MDILTFSRLDYRDASIITMYFVVLGIRIPKKRPIGSFYYNKKKLKSNMFKMDVQTFW